MSVRSEPAPKPIAVRILDVEDAVPQLSGLSGYESALVFFRQAGAVVGKRTIPLQGGAVPDESIRNIVNELILESGAQRPLSTPTSSAGATSDPFVTVAVCTRDRPLFVRRCLESLVEIKWPRFEILLVDSSPGNNETRDITKTFPMVRYARCRRPGLNRARNLAITMARGEIIAFTDDDVRVDPSWVKGLVQNFADPLVAVVTGITLPAELETVGQIEFEEYTSFTRGFRRRDYTIINTSPLQVAHIGAGANMAVRVSFLKEIGLFDVHLDAGTPTLSGGDHEFFSRTLSRGYRIIYEPSAIVWHEHKRSAGEAVRAVYGYGVGVFAWWTRAFTKEKEFSVLLIAPLCLIQYYFARAAKSLLKPANAAPLKYSWAELWGALVGPVAYIRSVVNGRD